VNNTTLYPLDSLSAVSGIRIIGGDYSMDSGGVDAQNINLYYANNVIIDGVFIENAKAGARNSHCIYIRGHSSVGYPNNSHSTGVSIRNSIIQTNETITSGTGYPIYLSKVDNVTVEGNKIIVSSSQSVATANTSPVYVDGYVSYLNMRNNTFQIGDVPTDRDSVPYLADSTGCTNLIVDGLPAGDNYAKSTCVSRLYNGSEWTRLVNSEEAFLLHEDEILIYENEILLY
jgi:hypothetical protein